MRFLALATDYDGTLATEGQVDSRTLQALQRLQRSGRKLLLVSGRRLDDLCAVFPQIDVFDCVVVENGALLYFPTTQEEQLLGDRPPELFMQTLRERNVQPLEVGRVIIATWKPHDVTVAQTIENLGLDLQMILNKGAVMVLPSGIDKAFGLRAALAKLHLLPEQTVAIGDAENDQAMLDICGFSVAVANALPTVKARVRWVTPSQRGQGVVELIEHLLASDA